MWRRRAAEASIGMCASPPALQPRHGCRGTDRTFGNFWLNDGLMPPMRTA
jgi:hypothetical protein